jgi:hypothetical protein
MVTLDVYSKYIKIIHKIFIKYIVPILQVYSSLSKLFYYTFKNITNDIYNYLYYIY